MLDVAWEFALATSSPGDSIMHSGLGPKALGPYYRNYLLFLTTSSTPTSKILSFSQQTCSRFPRLCSNKVIIIFPSGLLAWKNSLYTQPTPSPLTSYLISCNLSFLNSTETASVSAKFNAFSQSSSSALTYHSMILTTPSFLKFYTNQTYLPLKSLDSPILLVTLCLLIL